MRVSMPTNIFKSPQHLMRCRASLPNQKAARVRHTVSVHSYKRHQELFNKLTTMSEDDLEVWAIDHRDALTLSFLGWLAEEEAVASGAEQQRLWELGGKLTAVREGLIPRSAAQISEELATAAAAASASASASGADLNNSSASKGGQLTVAGSAPLAEAVRRSAALGLTMEGMGLLQQQAAALEATMGVTRARVLTEIIGRKKVEGAEEVGALMAAGAAGRILEVLIQVESREERAAMLPDAFTPPSSSSSQEMESQRLSGGTSSDEEEYDEEELSTTPLQLLQSVELWLRRAENGKSAAGGGGLQSLLLPGASLGMDVEQLVEVLQELREDILAVWDSASVEDF